MNVSGSNSKLETATTTVGSGFLNIHDGGLVNILRGVVGGAGANGVIDVDGGTLNTTGFGDIGYLLIGGDGGNGTVNVINSGVINSNTTLVGDKNGHGSLSISGMGAVINNYRTTVVGYGINSVGSVNISDGAVLNAAGNGNLIDGKSLILGYNSGSNGQVLVTGKSSVINAYKGKTVIGDAAGGSMLLQNGGRLNTHEVIIANQAGSEGSLNIGSFSSDSASEAGVVDPTAIITFGNGDGLLNFNHSDNNYTFSNKIQGNGTVSVSGGTTVLTAENTWGGYTNISNNGILKAGIQNTLSPNAIYNVYSAGKLELNGFSQNTGSINNAGLINLSGSQPGTILTVNGDYTGNDGLIIFGTALSDDNSNTDKLIVNGNTSGTSYVAVTNLGGSGAKTLNGIELIRVSGNSAGEFTQQGRIVAGAWDYHLTRGNGDNSNNWYLSSQQQDNGGGDKPDNGGGDKPDNGGGDKPDNGGDKPDNSDKSNNNLRPEAGSYSSNLSEANEMFLLRLHDRLGETQYTDVLTGEQKVTSMWMRNEGGHTHLRDANGQLKSQTNRYVLQMGGDIAQWSTDGLSRGHLGVMAGYGKSHSNTRSEKTGYRSEGTVEGYSAGLYGTWYENEKNKSGLYVDGWAQYNWFDNTVSGEEIVPENYKSSGMTASVESGYTFRVGENKAKNEAYFIQPKAQVTWMGVKASKHRESNGTSVEGDGDGNIQTSLGARAFINGYSESDISKNRVFQPFVEANWIHNTKSFGTRMDGVTVSHDGKNNIGELKAGVEGQLSKDIQVWGNVSQQLGGSGYNDTSGMLGVKYSFK